MNQLNYLKHIFYTPDIIHRRYDLDIPKQDTPFEWVNQAKRIAIAALPFFSLYKPAGMVISFGMGAVRAVSHLSCALFLQKQKNWKTTSFELFQAALVISTFASSIFNFTLGIAFSTSVDLFQNLLNIPSLLFDKQLSPTEKFEKILEELLQLLGSGVYLGFMISGSLEMILAFALVQATLSFLQAGEDIMKGRFIEATAKAAMGCIRFSQAKKYAEQIQQRKKFLASLQHLAFLKRVLKAKKVWHLLNNPLSNVPGQVDEKSTKLGEVNFGAHFHGMGKDLVKGNNLIFHTKIIDGKEMTELDFKVNHIFREKIQDMIHEISALDPKEIKQILEIAGSHARGVQVEKKEKFFLGNKQMGAATKITLNGLGSIFVGSDPDLPTMYNRVVIQMESQKNLYDFHELMTFLDMDRALHVSAKDDIERLKMGQLFRIFFPKEATPLERSKEFFDLPLDELKTKMIEKAPAMQQIFKNYYEKMTLESIIGGRMRYRIKGLAREVYEKGARGLTAAITGAYSNQELYERIDSILKMGMLSSEIRAQGKMNTTGMSSNIDFYSGGADSVFTQMISEKNCKEETKFSDFSYYNGSARFLISLDALETGTYQYYHDSFGNRVVAPSYYGYSAWGESYGSRENILEFTDTLQNKDPTYNAFMSNNFGSQEIMIKERIAPSFLTGIVVTDEQTRNGLMDYLRTQDIIKIDSAGQETILGISADRFIHATQKISEDLFIKHTA